MHQAECKSKVQGANAAVTSEQGTGASQPKAAPTPDLDDLTDLMNGLNPRGKAVIDADVSTHLKVALTSSTQYKFIHVHKHMQIYMYIYIYVPTYVLLGEQHFNTLACSKCSFLLRESSCPSIGERRVSVHHLC